MTDLATFIAEAKGQPPSWPLLDLIPHEKPMSLLDEVVTVGDGELLAKVTLHTDSVFAAPEGVPALVGIEYMAQAVAAFAGHRALKAGEQVRLGFLVGNTGFFPVENTLWVHVKELVQGDNGLAVFACCIRSESVCVSANLNVFQPEDPAAFLAQSE